MGQALYRKHRPKSLKEIVGQEHITETLDRALKQDRISHAYLFTGPRGTGKTSIARILAHEINNLPYDDDSAHLDIIEIDAASNRRIDEIRDLRDKVYVAPSSAKYKVYIIDEVHMLTKEAFNALLKTLEEPPAHVVFILATTDAHKLPSTIISRTQRFSFKPVEKSKVVAHLKTIADKEGLKVEPAALELIAEHGEGSFRDSISLLDQAISQDKTLSAAAVQELLGLPSDTAVEAILSSLFGHKQVNELVASLDSLYEQGYLAESIAKELSKHLRQQIINGQIKDRGGTELLARLIEVPASHDPEKFLEIVLLDSSLPTVESRPETVKAPREAIREPVKQPVAPKLDKPVTPKAEEPESQIESAPKASSIALKPADLINKLDASTWPQVLNALKGNHNTLYGIVRMAEPRFEEPGVVTLAFAFAFHQKRLNEARNRQHLSDVVNELTGQDIDIQSIVDKNVASTPPSLSPLTESKVSTPTKAASDPVLSTISNIFGGGELLE